MALGFRVRGEKCVIPALRDTQTLPGSMSAIDLSTTDKPPAEQLCESGAQ
jgi:hypothetical protein